MSKFLIVGLGNIGDEYTNTRHNIGFGVLDNIAKEHDAKFTASRLASVSQFKFKGKTILLVKPATYMNLSGKAINYWLQAEKISIENLLVITDDIALPLGTLRMKGKGSDGGHNGLKSIEETLGRTDYARLRFGIGSNFAKGRQVEYVLGNWSTDEEQFLIPRIKLAVEMVHSFATVGLQLTMTAYNNK